MSHGFERISTDNSGLKEDNVALSLKNGQLTSKIIGVYYDVYNELGHGFLESVYEKAMTFALTQAGLSVENQAAIPVCLRGHSVGDFRADIVVNNEVLIELKCARALLPEHYAQVIHYLRATPLEIALLFNFGSKPSFKRFLFDNPSKKIRVNPCESVAGKA